MPRKKRHSPAEKKALSYAKDRRNIYFGSNKAGRKSIPAAKARQNRRVRHATNERLTKYQTLGPEEAELIESDLAHDVDRHGSGGRYSIYEPLGDFVERQAAKRERRTGRKQWVKKNKAAAEAKGDHSFSWQWGGSDVASFFKSH